MVQKGAAWPLPIQREAFFLFCDKLLRVVMRNLNMSQWGYVELFYAVVSETFMPPA
jgi:hypothetical protein